MATPLSDADLAALSAAVYDGPDGVRQAAPSGWELALEESQGPYNRILQKAYVLRSNGSACMVFRGTVPGHLTDWLVNFRVRKRRVTYGRVHAGAFYRAASMYRRLAPHLGRLNHLYLTGHSLGGQMATVVAHVFFQGNRYPVDLVTFGAPKALSWCARRRFPGYIEVREYLDPRDPVGYVPVFNYWRINKCKVGKCGWIYHDPWHGARTYLQAVKALGPTPS